MKLPYDVVIATRNRIGALRLSIPLVLDQTRLPESLILVDASDDHAAVCHEIEKLAGSAAVHLQILHSSAGTSRQRNTGLDHVKSPVVMMPDDDSLWYPNFAEEVMRIYENDPLKRIGGVGGVEVPLPPMAHDLPTYKISNRDRLKSSLDVIPDTFERYFLNDPFELLGTMLIKAHGSAGVSVKQAGVSLIPKMDGYRMSYRTAFIEAVRFDELLGRYALFEDYDVCFGVLKYALVVESRKARMNHYKAPERRTSGFRWGVMQVINRAYIICKYAPPNSLPRQRILVFLYYRFFKSIPRIYSHWTLERLRGMYISLPFAHKLMATPRSQLHRTYSSIRKVLLQREFH